MKRLIMKMILNKEDRNYINSILCNVYYQYKPDTKEAFEVARLSNLFASIKTKNL